MVFRKLATVALFAAFGFGFVQNVHAADSTTGSKWDRSQSPYASNYAAGQRKPAEARASGSSQCASSTTGCTATSKTRSSASPYASNYAAGQSRPSSARRGSSTSK